MFTIGLLTAVFLVVFALLAGMVLTLIIQWYFFNRYLLKLPLASQSEEVIAEQFQIPQSLLEGDFKPEPAKALNSVLQFLFQECRNTKRVRRWFRTRLSIELEELLTRTTTGKLFEAIALRELHLGTQFPNIIDIEVKKFNVSPSCGLIDDLELCLQLEYCGGFQLTIDANMRLNKTARVSVKVNQLKGLGCLRFTRHPYTHWSFSFYSDPQLQLTVESQFQGRTLPQINSIIASQIRKALKRKHTLPNFKLRYKPFFHKSDPGVVADEGSSEMAVTGSLDVSVLQVSRISDTPGPVYCSLAVDSDDDTLRTPPNTPALRKSLNNGLPSARISAANGSAQGGPEGGGIKRSGYGPLTGLDRPLINLSQLYELHKSKFEKLSPNVLRNLIVGGGRLSKDINLARGQRKKWVTFLDFELNISLEEGDINNNDLTKQRFYACLHRHVYLKKLANDSDDFPNSPLIHNLDIGDSILAHYKHLLGLGFQFQWSIFMPELPEGGRDYSHFYVYLLGCKALDYLAYVDLSIKKGIICYVSFIEFLKNPGPRGGKVANAAIRNMGKEYQNALKVQKEAMRLLADESARLNFDRLGINKKIKEECFERLLPILCR